MSKSRAHGCLNTVGGVDEIKTKKTVRSPCSSRSSKWLLIVAALRLPTANAMEKVLDGNRLRGIINDMPKTSKMLQTQAVVALSCFTHTQAERCWKLSSYNSSICGGSELRGCWDRSSSFDFDCTQFSSCGACCDSSCSLSCDATFSRRRLEYGGSCWVCDFWALIVFVFIPLSCVILCVVTALFDADPYHWCSGTKRSMISPQQRKDLRNTEELRQKKILDNIENEPICAGPKYQAGWNSLTSEETGSLKEVLLALKIEVKKLEFAYGDYLFDEKHWKMR